MSDVSPCLTCGACCATYRVSFYWGETTDAPEGIVPAELTGPRSPLMRCMQGTDQKNPRCVALQGEIGHAVSCLIYPQRPSPCREVEVGSDQCVRARARHGLPELTPYFPDLPKSA